MYRHLLKFPLDESTFPLWMAQWSRLGAAIGEAGTLARYRSRQDTRDAERERQRRDFLERMESPWEEHENELKRRALSLGWCPDALRVPFRIMRLEADCFRTANIPVLEEIQRICMDYNRILGAQRAEWEGREVNPTQLARELESPDRDRRERAWRLRFDCSLADRGRTADVWRRLMEQRTRLASNAGLPGFTPYAWATRGRLDYTPEDCFRFHEGVRLHAVPALARHQERLRLRLGLDVLRPWDLKAPTPGTEPASPVRTGGELVAKALEILKRVHPTAAELVGILQTEDLLDLESRPGKAPGASCGMLPYRRRPVIFQNATGTHRDIFTLFHEFGHALHAHLSFNLPYLHQWFSGYDFAEVASMSMEQMASEFLDDPAVGLCTEADKAQALMGHLTDMLWLWTQVAAVDSFQHWAYSNPDRAKDVEACDSKWEELMEQYHPGVDWSGLGQQRRTAWHSLPHIFLSPFYYMEYGLASMASVQIGAKYRRDPDRAFSDYQRALSLGGTATARDLYATAGATLSFDPDVLAAAVEAVESDLLRLEKLTVSSDD